MGASGLRALFKGSLCPLKLFNRAAPCSLYRPSWYLSQHYRLCNLSYSSAAQTHQAWCFSSEGESAEYKHALRFQPPSSIRYRQQLFNSVCFIGTIDYPPRKVNISNGAPGLHCLLNVKPSPRSCRSFKVLLMMWDEIAEISMQHLKRNDLVYVWGHLGSYVKTDENGDSKTHYKVIVKEINYVMQRGQCSTCQEPEKVVSRGEDGSQKIKSQLHLWQIFFSNPHEWWDNRKTKARSKQPDFRHKDTGEALWLHPKDPQWVKRQLELYDARISERSFEKHAKFNSYLSPMVCDTEHI